MTPCVALCGVKRMDTFSSNRKPSQNVERCLITFRRAAFTPRPPIVHCSPYNATAMCLLSAVRSNVDGEHSGAGGVNRTPLLSCGYLPTPFKGTHYTAAALQQRSARMVAMCRDCCTAFRSHVDGDALWSRWSEKLSRSLSPSAKRCCPVVTTLKRHPSIRRHPAAALQERGARPCDSSKMVPTAILTR